ncbi:hypothetical protein QWY93_13650 [Echinicola jeungdonensis]|uniref:Uncharacterized protein n=1 Tax=Echinicola jeungdonensis TaxID=709343 RepID=A0ABV5JA76_9BACT|nr:hypothetical protein [Echinicola jeungdonensis]MDN3670361.1 hypothetical protein [Echinicola jeungdonensis]
MENFSANIPLNVIRKYSRFISLILIPLFLNLIIIGCSYYKVTQVSNDPVEIRQAQEQLKYFIIHQGDNSWHLKNIRLKEDSKEMVGEIEPLPPEHQSYLKTDPERANRYRVRKEFPLHEVHVYVSEYVKGENSKVTVPLSSIKKIEVYDKDKGATTLSYVFGTIGVIVGAVFIIGLIIGLTGGSSSSPPPRRSPPPNTPSTSSCPFIYTYDGKGYNFIGEMYGGAIYSSLERDDYMLLPGLDTHNGKYQLKIANELLERQYTNLSELMVVEHPENTQVLADKNGQIFTINSALIPTKAESSNHTSYFNAISKKDSSFYLFDEENDINKNLSNLTLTFKKPKTEKNGKLILNGKNSLWLDFIFGKFNEQFGTYYPKFAEKQKNVPANKNLRWSLNQGIPLSVYIETKKGWEFVDYFNVVGPLASRDMVMDIDLSNVEGEEVKLKLECGFMFWEVDYIAMDYSENTLVDVSYLSPETAIDENGNDVSDLLTYSDEKYLVQPEVGNKVVVTYPTIPVEKNKKQTLFLHSKGYYEYIRDYKNKPNLIHLYSFKRKGAFPSFSKQYLYNFVDREVFFIQTLNQGDEN